jgi:hypothetical protein
VSLASENILTVHQETIEKITQQRKKTDQIRDKQIKIFDQIKMTQKLEETETEKKLEEKYDSDMYGIVEGLMSNLQEVQKAQI